MCALSLSQADVPASLLIRSAERVMVDSVALVGLRINHVIRSAHTKNVLQFLSGLGPRKEAVCCMSLAAWFYFIFC